MDHRESGGSQVDRWMEATGSEESVERMSLWRVSRSNRTLARRTRAALKDSAL